jgi:hypothetical protein
MPTVVILVTGTGHKYLIHDDDDDDSIFKYTYQAHL